MVRLPEPPIKRPEVLFHVPEVEARVIVNPLASKDEL